MVLVLSEERQMRHCWPAGRSSQRGFSYIELMIAMVVLAVGLLGGIIVICAASANNGSSKLRTTAGTLAEGTLERIIALPPGAATTVSDCQGNSFDFQTAQPGPGGPALINPFGDTQVDFSQPAIPGYSMLYAMCSPGQVVRYDVRWTINPGPTPSTELVTVSARPATGPAAPAATFVLPVSLSGVRGAN